MLNQIVRSPFVSRCCRHWRSVCGFAVLAVVGLWLCESASVAADRPPEVQKAIQRGLDFLHKSSPTEFEAGLAIYASLAAGTSPEDPWVKTQLAKVLKKFTSDGYHPLAHHHYEAGIDAMALVGANRELYKPQIQAVADFLIREQRDHGGWDYVGQNNGGDTSISQYGMLGLWAAARAGIAVPVKTWDRCAAWHFRTQLNDGAFSYHPNGADRLPKHSMTVAGVGSLCIARIYLTDPSQAAVEPSEPDAESTT
ncbi:MAG TPA: hypothetical protein VK137_01945, partial [Planctomycetaceae bacterium]|nr:hypothetical protein [Planctomycetaceae bacterium]